VVLLLVLTILALASAAGADDVPTAQDAIERARALERAGHADDAEAYLAGLVEQETGPLAGEADVLLEAARVSDSPEDVRALAGRAIERTRNARILHEAHILRGDSYYAQRLYLTASSEYESAARYAQGRGPGTADLKRARSILASGDAEAAVAAYEDLVGRCSREDEARPAAELGLGTSLLAAGRAEEAAVQFDKTLEANAESELRAQVLAGAARSYAEIGDIAQAAERLERLVELDPSGYEAVIARERLREYEPVLADTLVPVEADSLPESPAR
jgi:tetratricopeptide (TPR) repeat protein